MSKRTWLYALSLCAGVAGVAAAGSACTVTTTTINDDGGTNNNTDGGGGSDAQSDTATSDTGTTCSATTTCSVVGTRGTFDNCGTCDKCAATQCCTEVTACLGAAPDGGNSDCDERYGCLEDCVKTDGGSDCIAACNSAYAAGIPAAQAMENCIESKCKAECP